MKQRNLKTCSDAELVNLYYCIDFIFNTNETKNILSRTEIKIINNWKKQIHKTI